MSTWKEIARRGLRAALETRRRAGVARSAPICIYDLAEALDLEVKFCGGNSFGGMYAKTSQTILVPTLRPPGRRAFTCAHEIGHWYFGHGTRVDRLEDIEDSDVASYEERLANAFASYLLMPPWAVEEAFAKRGSRPATCSAEQVYAVACQFGVGYETLVQHLYWSLNAIAQVRADDLLTTSPKRLRKALLGHDRSPHLVLSDMAWSSVPIDLQVGDSAAFPQHAKIEGDCVVPVGEAKCGLLVEGHRPGIGRVEANGGLWCAFIRVCRKDFVGRSIYRHLEDPDGD